MIGDFESVYVVDSGSSDSTQALAKSAGALVLERIQQGAFDHVDQKNWALTQVESSSGWVLFMDADERATTSFVQAVRGLSTPTPTISTSHTLRRIHVPGDLATTIYGVPELASPAGAQGAGETGGARLGIHPRRCPRGAR